MADPAGVDGAGACTRAAPCRVLSGREILTSAPIGVRFMRRGLAGGQRTLQSLSKAAGDGEAAVDAILVEAVAPVGAAEDRCG